MSIIQFDDDQRVANPNQPIQSLPPFNYQALLINPPARRNIGNDRDYICSQCGITGFLGNDGKCVNRSGCLPRVRATTDEQNRMATAIGFVILLAVCAALMTFMFVKLMSV